MIALMRAQVVPVCTEFALPPPVFTISDTTT